MCLTPKTKSHRMKLCENVTIKEEKYSAAQSIEGSNSTGEESFYAAPISRDRHDGLSTW